MVTILQHFQKVTTSEEKTHSPQQLVAVAKRWSSHMDRLLANHMPYPCIVVTVPEEVALYGNVQQVRRSKIFFLANKEPFAKIPNGSLHRIAT